MRVYLIIIVGIMAFCYESFSQNQIEVKLSTDTILVGQPAFITYTLSCVNEKNCMGIKWRIPEDSLGSKLGILKFEQADSDSVSIREVAFTSEQPGYWAVEPITAYLPNGISLSTKAQLITVLTTLEDPDSAELRENKENIEISYSSSESLMFLIPLALILYTPVICLIFYFYRKERDMVIRFTDEQVTESPPSAAEIAFSKLEKLQTSKPWLSSSLKEYHSALSLILREYFNQQLGINALESTTKEILRELKLNGTSEINLASIKKMLTLTDLVKFAKQKPSPDENAKLINEAQKIVELFDLKTELNEV